jgi:hypothetical protein
MDALQNSGAAEGPGPQTPSEHRDSLFFNGVKNARK